MSKNFQLNNRVAVITGGVGLLGLEHAKSLLSAGATVYLADIDVDKGIQICKNLGKNCKFLYLNVTDEKNVRDYQTKNLLRDRHKSKNYEAFSGKIFQ